MTLPNTITSRLRLSYIGLAAIPLLIVGVVLTWSTYSTQQSQVLQLQQELAHRVATEVEGSIHSLESSLRVTAGITNLASRTHEEQRGILDQLRSEEKEFVEISIIDPNGQEVVRSSYLEIVREEDYRDFSTDAAYLSLINGTENVYYSPVNYSDASQPYMTIAIPLIDLRSGAVSAIVVAQVRFKEIWNLIASIDVGEGGSIFIIDSAEQVIAHQNTSIVLAHTTYQRPEKPSVTQSLIGNKKVLTGEWQITFGEQVFTVVAEAPVGRVLQLATRSWVFILALVILTSGAAGLLALIAANVIIRPIQDLALAAERIRQGDLSHSAASSGLRELDTLATAFNSMTNQLRQTLEGLEQRVADRTQALRTSAEVSRNLSTILDRDQLVTEVAQLVQSSFNYYHVNIFLFDETAENLLLVAASGEPAQAQLVGEYTVPKQLGLIGKAATTNQPVLIPDVSKNDQWLPNRWLPETKSELAVPITRGGQVLGVLDVQHHTVDGLQQEDTDLMQSIANQLAVALQNALSFEQLLQEKLTEVKQKEEAEKRLDAYRRSPVGQAERFAEKLLAHPEQALIELYQLTQLAGQRAEVAASLSHLPKILSNKAQNDGQEDSEIDRLADLAEGYNYLFASQHAPELLPVGLRILTRYLRKRSSRSPAEDWPWEREALTVYQLCQAAVEANTIGQVVQLDWNQELEEVSAAETPFLLLVQRLLEFQSVRETLVAYEWVSSAQDKLAYLVSATERLRHIERQSRSALTSADLSIVLRIGEVWQALITGALSELQTQARLNCRLLTRRTWQSDVISLSLSIQNDGRGPANNLKVSLLAGPEYTLLEETAEVAQLAPGDESQVTLCVRPRLEQSVGQFRVRFAILYDDPRGPGQSEHFADVVQLLYEQTPFQYIPNPYVVGTPLEAGSTLFFGREELLAAIQENLSSGQRNNLVLIGQRRMGKTSLLKQLANRLGDGYLPVYLDGQVMGLDPDMASFFLNLATEIAFALEDRGIEIVPPETADFGSSPATYFERQFLARVRTAIERRHLIILFDEFEELESAVRRGYLDSSIFGFLRHLMQHSANLTFIFCGTHRLEELAADYWSVLFNISLYHRVGYLAQEEATRLILQPVEPFGMRYDDLALDKMWRVTAGHPYFLQLLCHSLVNLHNKSQRSYITVGDLNAALDEILSTGEAHFIYLWMESTLEERLALVAMSRLVPLTGSVRAVQIVEYLAERGVKVERQIISDALYHLALRDILRADEREGYGENVYRWQLGLLGLWVEKYKSLGRVAAEVAA